MLEPSHLRTLRAVLATGSFAAAATVLQYTPSAVSQQIAALERASGLTLFERGPQHARATPLAQAMAEQAAGILTGLDELERDVAALARGEAGVLRVGSFPTAGARILPRALAALTKARPGIELRLDEGELDQLLPGVDDGRLDLALTYRYDLVPGDHEARLVEHALLREPLQLLLPRARRMVGPVHLRDLRDRRWVAPLAGSPGAVNLERLCAEARFTPNVTFRSNDYAVVRGLVAAGLGVALVPALAIADHARDVDVHPVLGRRAYRHVLAVHRPGNANPLLAPAIEALRHAATRPASR